jgi:hypothetical protein
VSTSVDQGQLSEPLQLMAVVFSSKLKNINDGGIIIQGQLTRLIFASITYSDRAHIDRVHLQCKHLQPKPNEEQGRIVYA